MNKRASEPWTPDEVSRVLGVLNRLCQKYNTSDPKKQRMIVGRWKREHAVDFRVTGTWGDFAADGLPFPDGTNVKRGFLTENARKALEDALMDDGLADWGIDSDVEVVDRPEPPSLTESAPDLHASDGEQDRQTKEPTKRESD